MGEAYISNLIYNFSTQFSGSSQLAGMELPLRVLPGRLSVSRTFGDMEAKVANFGGKPGVVIAAQDISIVNIKDQSDFIFLGCDGIFDKLTNEDVSRIIWIKAREEYKMNKNIHEIAGECVTTVLCEAMKRRSLDNVTGILIFFKGFEERLQQETTIMPCKEETKSKISTKLLIHRRIPIKHFSQKQFRSQKSPVKSSMFNLPRIKEAVEIEGDLNIKE